MKHAFLEHSISPETKCSVCICRFSTTAKMMKFTSFKMSSHSKWLHLQRQVHWELTVDMFLNSFYHHCISCGTIEFSWCYRGKSSKRTFLLLDYGVPFARYMVSSCSIRVSFCSIQGVLLLDTRCPLARYKGSCCFLSLQSLYRNVTNRKCSLGQMKKGVYPSNFI